MAFLFFLFFASSDDKRFFAPEDDESFFALEDDKGFFAPEDAEAFFAPEDDEAFFAPEDDEVSLDIFFLFKKTLRTTPGAMARKERWGLGREDARAQTLQIVLTHNIHSTYVRRYSYFV